MSINSQASCPIILVCNSDILAVQTPMKDPDKRLKAIGVDSLVFDPCGNRPDQEDFLSVMRRNVKNLKQAFP